jgi:hypothetical protein
MVHHNQHSYIGLCEVFAECQYAGTARHLLGVHPPRKYLEKRYLHGVLLGAEYHRSSQLARDLF